MKNTNAVLKYALGVCVVFSLAFVPAMSMAQEVAKESILEVQEDTDLEEDTAKDVLKGQVMLDEEGHLSGVVFVLKDDEKMPMDAKVSLASTAGVIIDSVKADDSGAFAFPNVEPGTYEMYASAESFVGTQSVEVMPYSDAGTFTSGVQLGMTQDFGGYDTGVVNYDTMYDSYAGMPAETFSTNMAPASFAPCGGGCASACGPSSCGGFSGGGCCGGGIGSGRALGFLRNNLGLIGLVGLAGLDGPSSPDN